MTGFSTRRAEFARAEADRGTLDRGGMRRADRWLAVLRVVVGLWFLKSVATKLTVVLLWGVLPVPAASQRWVGTMPTLLARYMADTPLSSLRDVVEQTVIPNATLFANLTAFGEAVVGIGLTLGVCTALAAAVGLFLSVTYGLATAHASPGQQGFHLLLVACMIAFIGARAGRRWGLDGWIRTHHPRSRAARILVG